MNSTSALKAGSRRIGNYHQLKPTSLLSGFRSSDSICCTLPENAPNLFVTSYEKLYGMNNY
eukprot:c14768_g1_i2 orf=73-255(+)